MFLGEKPEIARFDVVRYPFLEKLTRQQIGFFWIPEEVDVSKDKSDFRALLPAEQHIFTSNLKRQIVLDTVQGRDPNTCLLPHASEPEVEVFISTWAFFETIHSRSYTHIIRNVYSNPSEVFDTITTIPEIKQCAVSINEYYDAFEKQPTEENLWRCLMSINILEGVRFYVSFACSWAFAELKKMEGNAKIIKFIARDENVHLAATTQMLKTLAKEDKDFEKIKEQTSEECIQMFVDAIEQEKFWAEYLFRDGSMIGLNAELLKEYIEWIGAKRMKSLGLPCPYNVSQANPLPWTQKWIGGGDVQVAPQETEITSYVVGGIEKDVSGESFKGFSL